MVRGKWFLMGLKFTLGFILYFMVLAWVIMKLWNGLVPDLTGWASLNYNNALILLVLVRLLVGFRFMGTRFFKHRFGHKWSKLSEEEREDLREKFKHRWCQKE
jgi:Ca2+/H+ antiporter, TMEM165/GDT1 family